jgi:cobalt-zinc-cadmium efflux system protein
VHADGHPHPSLAELAAGRRRALWLTLAANAALLVAEVAGGVAFHSLALLADAAHLLTDVAALGIAVLAERLVGRPATTRHSFGFQRAEVLGAQANAVVLLAAAGWIGYEAVRRIGSPGDVRGGGLLAVAAAGLVVNVASAALLARSSGGSLNMRAAYTHMAADAAGSVGAMLAGAAILLWRATWTDPAVSIAVGGLVVWAAWRLLRDATHVLLEGTPKGISADAVVAALAADPAVESVHHLHLWNLASEVPALSAHVILHGERTLHEAQATADRLKAALIDRFAIEHSTLELECHACDGPEPAHDLRATPPPSPPGR